MPAAVRAATAPMAPDAPEEKPDLWPGGGNGDEPVVGLVGGNMLPAKVVVVAGLDVLEFAAKGS
jgi:hypothetical protein